MIVTDTVTALLRRTTPSTVTSGASKGAVTAREGEPLKVLRYLSTWCYKEAPILVADSHTGKVGEERRLGSRYRGSQGGRDE